MSFVKLDEQHQALADEAYEIQKKVMEFIERVRSAHHLDSVKNQRWLAIANTDIEKSFMSVRKAITEKFKATQKELK